MLLIQILFLLQQVASPPSSAQKPFTLERAIQMTLMYSPAVKSARAKQLLVEAERLAERSWLYPRFSLNAFAAPAGQENMFATGAEAAPDTMRMLPDENLLIFRAALTYPLSTGGLLTARAKAADLESQVALSMRSNAVIRAVAETRRRYVDLWEAEEIARAQADEISALSETVKNVQARFDAGKTAKVDVLRAQANLAAAEADQAELALRVAQLKEELRRAIGAFSGYLNILEEPQIEIPPGPDYEDIAFESRPDYQAAVLRQEVAEQLQRAAQAQYKPQIFLHVAYDFPTPQRPSVDLLSGGRLALTATFPIFDGGQRQAMKLAAQAKADEAQAALEKSTWDVMTSIHHVQEDLKAAETKLKAAQSGLAFAEEAYRIDQVRYEAGKGILVELLDSQARLTQAKAQVASAKAMRSRAAAMLLEALGLQ